MYVNTSGWLTLKKKRLYVLRIRFLSHADRAVQFVMKADVHPSDGLLSFTSRGTVICSDVLENRISLHLHGE